MPTISQSACKRLLFGERLTVWGVHMRETYTPGGHGDGQRGAQKVYHYPAALDWLADISEAFAHLSPDTPLRGIRFSTLTRQRFNPHQWAVWYFYVDGLGDLSKADKAKVVQLAGESKMERGLRDWRGDERVGAKLGVGGRQANRLRCEAVGLLAVRLAGEVGQEGGVSASGVRPETPRTVKMVEVIVVEALRGLGQMGDPVRVVTQYWSLQGELLAESDPVKAA